MRTITENGLTIIDPNLPEFSSTDNDQLGYIFKEYNKQDKLIIPVPKSYFSGVGKGYLNDVIEHTTTDQLSTLYMYNYGVPIYEPVMFLSNFDLLKKASKRVTKIPKNMSFKRHHCTIPMKRVNNDIDLISQGFEISSGAVFKNRQAWREITPIVQCGKTGDARLMTDKECIVLFGESKPTGEIPLKIFTKLASMYGNA